MQDVAACYDFCCSGVRGANTTGHALSLLRDHIDLAWPPDYQRLVLAGALDLLYRSKARALRTLPSTRKAQTTPRDENPCQ